MEFKEASPDPKIIQPYANFKFEKILAAKYNISAQVWNMAENCPGQLKPAFIDFEGHRAKVKFKIPVNLLYPFKN